MRQTDPGPRHMRYLNRLIPMESKSGKRADWTKFCHVCGADISRLAKFVRTCSDCAPVREEQKLTAKQERDNRTALARRWQRRIQSAGQALSMPRSRRMPDKKSGF